MKDKFYVPWEIAVRLYLHGYEEDCVTAYMSRGKKLYIPTRYGFSNYPGHDGGRLDDYNRGTSLAEVLKRKGWVAAPTFDQVKDWFSINHSIDFIEMPLLGMEKKYTCNPAGIGGQEVRLPPQPTLREAMIEAFDYALDHVKPLGWDKPKEKEVVEEV